MKLNYCSHLSSWQLMPIALAFSKTRLKIPNYAPPTKAVHPYIHYTISVQSGIAAELQLSGLKKLGWGTGELQFLACKKPSIYGDDNLSHDMSVLSQYFHLVSTECKMDKILDIFFYLKHNKTNLRTHFKSQNGKKYLHVNQLIRPSTFCLPQTLNVFFITCIFVNFCSPF